ncbi:MAG: hypothetical protein H7Y60_18435 [Rhodospirillaceae bacterium]|nr:hypothetical protein [Rhodospirillales bacterium]
MRLLPLAFVVTALTAPAFAQTQAQQPAGERLMLNPPTGWSPVPVQRNDKMVVTRLFPPGENDKQWSQSITLQLYPNSDQLPRAFAEGIVAYSRDNCEAAGPGPINEAMTNGYPIASVTVTCTKGRSSGMGGFALVQAIRGKDALYVVQRQWRGAAFSKNQSPNFPPTMLKEWGDFAKTVGLCDSRDQRHPCP